MTEFLTDVQHEIERARKKFPAPNANLAAMFEEAGEVAKAMISESPGAIYTECVQLAAMAARIAEEGDPLYAAYRDENCLEPHPRKDESDE